MHCLAHFGNKCSAFTLDYLRSYRIIWYKVFKSKCHQCCLEWVSVILHDIEDWYPSP
jgi:hypothetical protein